MDRSEVLPFGGLWNFFKKIKFFLEIGLWKPPIFALYVGVGGKVIYIDITKIDNQGYWVSLALHYFFASLEVQIDCFLREEPWLVTKKYLRYAIALSEWMTYTNNCRYSTKGCQVAYVISLLGLLSAGKRYTSSRYCTADAENVQGSLGLFWCYQGITKGVESAARPR